MRNKKTELNKFIKVAMKCLIVAFLYVILIISAIYFSFKEKIITAITLIKNINIEQQEDELDEIKLIQNRLIEYPNYGEKYGKIEIESIDVKLDLYYGDLLSILRKGIGQTAGSYFPGEGGSIICMGHNTKGYLEKLSNVNIGDIIKVQTMYGEYEYIIYETKVVNQEELEELPIQKNQEVLMLYTCYPNNTFGHAKQRFVTYSRIIKD